MTTILAQLSDPHMRVGPGDQGSAAALRDAVETVLRLDPLPMPVHVLPGNHDALDWDGPYAADCGDLRLVVCDTTIAGRDDGHLDVDWLEAQLAQSTAPTIVAMHHPPLLTGIGGLDALGLPGLERAALQELLDRVRAARLPRPYRGRRARAAV
jgi:3',5'-cyclic AMP phosphodiesterase CpdA